MQFIKRAQAVSYMQFFLVFSVIAVLFTRLFLKLTNYPTLGGDSIHIAHMLWGGMLLVIGGLLLLLFHGKNIRYASAIFMGLGFGLFIDEIGKFITHDNNYFYEPAAMIIYLFFIVLVFIYSWTKKVNETTAKEKLYQVFDYLEEIIEEDFEHSEKIKVLSLLEEVEKTKQYPSFTKQIISMVHKQRAKMDKEQTWIEKSWVLLSTMPEFIQKKPFFRIMIVLLAINGIVSILGFLYTFLKLIFRFDDLLLELNSININNPELIIFGVFISSAALSAFYVIKGIAILRKNENKALQLFKRGLLIRILIVHLFTFYFFQFNAAIAVLLDLLFLLGVQYLIDEKTEK